MMVIYDGCPVCGEDILKGQDIRICASMRSERTTYHDSCVRSLITHPDGTTDDKRMKKSYPRLFSAPVLVAENDGLTL